MNKLLELIHTPNLCPRCYTGIDDDHDGNCAKCARLTDKRAAEARLDRLQAIANFDRKLIQLHEESALEAWGLKTQVTAVADELQALVHKSNQEIVGVIESIPAEYRVRVREGAGPENLFASLAVSVAKMVSEHQHLKRKLL